MIVYMVLFIIGNGFDLEHGMATGYGDFKRWLIRNNRFDVIQELQSAYPFRKDYDYLLWSDFEKALGEYDIDIALNWSWENLNLMVDSLENMVSNRSVINVQLSDIIDEAFSNWVRSIQIADKPKFDLPGDSLFLTFNYTDTLEKLYRIPEDQVFHIHGRASKGDKLIVGHNREIETMAYYDKSLGVRENNERVQRLFCMNTLRKPCQDLIEQNGAYFNKLDSVEEVYVIGHSCATVDYPYFRKIKESVVKDAKWKINTHSEEDVIRRDELKEAIGIA